MMQEQTYEEQLLRAYLGRDKSYDWYKRAFDYYDAHEGRLMWYWNSWAMIGNFWYFIHRKQMKYALIILFAFLLMSALLPLIWGFYNILFVSVAMGGFATYVVYKDFKIKKENLEKIIDNEAKRIIVMKHQFGGINHWAVPMGIVTLVSFVLIVVALVALVSK